MPRHTSVVVAALVAISSTTAQEPAAEDWPDAVRKAVEHRRFAVRRAAAGKVARAGDAAVPAIRAFIEERGATAIPLELVDAIARSDATGPATEALLESWTTDVEFYWRAQALGGLARRGVPRFAPLFRRAVDDPSYLTRIEGARGLLGVSDDDGDRQRVRALLADEDPRARLRVALQLLEAGDGSGVGEIVAAVHGAERSFVDDPWGGRDAVFALREIRRITGQDFTAALDEGEPRQAARARLVAWAKDANPSWEPAGRQVPDLDDVGGVEIRSCRNGDLFLRWTADGRFFAGLDPVRPVEVPAAEFERLRAALPALAGVATHGRVICDYVRLLVPPTPDGETVEVHHKAAPSALPAPVHEWLKALATALDESGEGARLRDRLGQFTATERKQ